VVAAGAARRGPAARLLLMEGHRLRMQLGLRGLLLLLRLRRRCCCGCFKPRGCCVEQRAGDQLGWCAILKGRDGCYAVRADVRRAVGGGVAAVVVEARRGTAAAAAAAADLVVSRRCCRRAAALLMLVCHPGAVRSMLILRGLL